MTAKESYESLELAIAALTRSNGALKDDQDSPETVTDAVLVVGSQWFSENGDRCGRVTVYPRNGSQPYYITEGLLHAALANVSGVVNGD